MPAAGYSGTPLPRKLGLKPGTTALLMAAPPDFPALLAPLPAGVTIHRRAGGTADFVLLFAKSSAALRAKFPRAIARIADGGKVWICWPKKASGARTDLTEDVVRAAGLALGWVDFKVCAIDAFWSGLCFACRREAGGAVS